MKIKFNNKNKEKIKSIFLILTYEENFSNRTSEIWFKILRPLRDIIEMDIKSFILDNIKEKLK